MTGPEAYADAEKQPASPGLDPDPRVPDGWWDELVDTPPASGRLLGLLLAALSGALVGGILVFAVVR